MNTKEVWQYRLAKGLFSLMGYLPWWAIRVLTSAFAFIAYRVVRYRLKVVRDNLRRSFPDRSTQEIKEIEQAYYLHFIGIYLSTPKLLSRSPEELRAKHLRLDNLELFTSLRQKGHKHFIVLMAHYGNWELFSSAQIYFTQIGIQQEQIYRPLRNKAMDTLFVDLRTRYGSLLIPKNSTGRRITSVVRSEESPSTLFAFIADQTPGINALHYWTDFLNQPTSFLDGAERLARKLQIPVLYMDIERTNQYGYRGTFELISEHPEQTAPYEITELFAQRLELSIRNQPPLWLWSHKRWKHKFTPDRAEYISPTLIQKFPTSKP